MKLKHLLASSIIALGLATMSVANAGDMKVKITPKMGSVTVKHNGKSVTIQRNQNNKNDVIPAFAKTSRNCPPFCINPMQLAPGVETVGEIEMLHYLKTMSDGDKSILVVDSRTPDWVARGTIPGAINLPWTKLNPAKGATPIEIAEIMEKHFGVTESEGLFNFSKAKTLVLFCNGMWCGQSPNNIRNLMKFGYPAHKIKWYRGGMQNWENLGFTTVK
ncbi:MAG: rhodanese-like domain-containing protein [Gammaproteobacteria bacterium]|nr:rhodanese-like domain-containing protein [Gammaproteobacteria bacterium]